MNPHHKPRLFHLVHLNLTAVVAAVRKRKPVTVPMLFRRHLITQNHKRIMLVAGHSPFALYRLNPMMKRQPLRHTLHCVPSIEMNQVHVLVRIIHLQRHCTLYRNCLLSLIFHPDCPGYHIKVIKHSV